MTKQIEFFFDLSSPWTRVAFHNVQGVAAQTGASILWRPFLVGGVFNAVNESVYAGRADPNHPKVRHNFTWLKEWADLAGVPMNFPSRYHPVKSVAAMRFCCALEHDHEQLFRFITAAFDAYFRDKRNLDDVDCLIEIASECGLDGPAVAERSVTDAVKAALRKNTDEAIERGAFGSPMMFVGGHVYFGNDQLPLVRQRLMRGDSV